MHTHGLIPEFAVCGESFRNFLGFKFAPNGAKPRVADDVSVHFTEDVLTASVVDVCWRQLTFTFTLHSTFDFDTRNMKAKMHNLTINIQGKLNLITKKAKHF